MLPRLLLFRGITLREQHSQSQSRQRQLRPKADAARGFQRLRVIRKRLFGLAQEPHWRRRAAAPGKLHRVQ